MTEAALQREELSSQLGSAKRAARDARLRITGPSLLCSSVLFLLALLIAPFMDYIPENVVTLPIFIVASFWCIIFLLLGILPTDRDAIRGFSAVALVLNAVVIGIFPWTYGAYLTRSEMPDWYRFYEFGIMIVMEVVFVRNFAYLANSLYRLNPREQLKLCWTLLHQSLLVRCVLDAGSALFMIVYVARDNSDDGARLATCVLLSLSLCATAYVIGLPTFRSRVQAYLMTMGGGQPTAAATAQLIRNQDVATVLEAATAKFRCVRCDQVTPDIFRSKKADQSLYQLSTAAELGDVDAFVSHSWCDDPDAKWDALQEWRAKFWLAEGREPTLWIDRICIEGSDIEDNLLCLPVFLAGTKKLLVLAGTSYLHRLWCVVELLTFINMRGSSEDLDLCLVDESCRVPVSRPAWYPSKACSEEGIAPGVVSHLQNTFADFDAANARCYLKSDHDHLLAIMEAGCVDMGNVNSAVRTMLLERCAALCGPGENTFSKGAKELGESGFYMGHSPDNLIT
eukprot:TRINITY_DN61379_c0_g1_i1.p1 TRINITY_DN61379_c0_g1~~TRINITY_DN61379_c0_g1_i1.p1  ORF type:complete len:511 (+),score=61.64 TRINITY_DN61379_c0_g1_i1:53-1585(+)